MRPGGPRQDSLDLVQYGLHYAVVCQNKDPDNMNRVKVKLPWLDNGDKDQTWWAQLMTPMEGKKFGWYTLPDVDDVVIVMFVAGDTSMPVIVGGIWSKPDFSPEPNEDGKNNFRGYRSRAGSRLVFDDSGKVKIWFADKSGKNFLAVGDYGKEGAGPNVCEVFKPAMGGSSGVALATMEGKLETTAKTKLKVSATNIKINSKTTIDIKAGGNFTLEASSSIKVTSSSPSNYDASKIDIA